MQSLPNREAVVAHAIAQGRSLYTRTGQVTTPRGRGTVYRGPCGSDVFGRTYPMLKEGI
jgi:hypothetical protein